MARKVIDNTWDRLTRNNLNENFEELYDTVGETGGYFENNRGVDYPLKNMMFRGTTGTISQQAKDAILDAKVFGANVDSYYRLTMIANGNESKGKNRYGITLEEYRKSDFTSTGYRSKNVFIYNDDDDTTNSGNANYIKGSDGIDTISVDNGEIACSITVDRSKITGLFLNLNNPHAPTAIIDPSNYFF